MSESFGGINRFMVVELEPGQSATPDLRMRGRALKLNVATKVRDADAHVFCKAAVDQDTARQMYDAHLVHRRGDVASILDSAPGNVPNHYIVCDEPWSQRYPGDPIPDADPSIPALPPEPPSRTHPFHVIIATKLEDDPGDLDESRRRVSQGSAIEGRHARRAASRGLVVLTPVPDTHTLMKAVIATRATISPEEAQRLWDMHEEFVDENGGDGVYEHTYELTPPDEIVYTSEDPGNPKPQSALDPQKELCPLPAGSRFAFVPIDVPRGDPLHVAATDAGLDHMVDVLIDLDVEEDEQDAPSIGEHGEILIENPREHVGWIYAPSMISEEDAGRLYHMSQAHDRSPNSLLERLEDGTTDHFVVHDRTWAARVQGKRAARLAERVLSSGRETVAISRNRRRSGTMKEITPTTPQDAMMRAAALVSLSERVTFCSAELDTDSAAIWGDLQPHQSATGDPAVGMLVRIVAAAVEHAGLPRVNWIVSRRGDAVEVRPDLPEDAPDDLFENLAALGGVVDADVDQQGCDITYGWPRRRFGDEDQGSYDLPSGIDLEWHRASRSTDHR